MSRSPVPSRIIYSDLTINADSHPISNILLTKRNDEAVKQAIRTLILTDKGERLFQPGIGGDIRAMLFENATPQTFFTIQQVVKAAIETYEPRAEVIDVAVSSTDDLHGIQITIVFRAINIQEPVTLDVILERVR